MRPFWEDVGNVNNQWAINMFKYIYTPMHQYCLADTNRLAVIFELWKKTDKFPIL